MSSARRIPGCGQNGQRADLPSTVALSLIDIREIAPPPGVTPVHWRLLTTRAVTTLPEAHAVANLYRRRWAIEQFFRTLKTEGFDVEHVRIAADIPRHNLITATVAAAVCIQQVVHARDGGQGPLRPLTEVFQPEDQAPLQAACARLQGKTQRQKNPHPKRSLAYGTWVCARLCGWTGYYGKPGPIVVLRGWLDFQTMKRGITLLAQADQIGSAGDVLIK